MADLKPICERTAFPGFEMAGFCPDCGHAIVMHLGVESCVVCELVHLVAGLRD